MFEFESVIVPWSEFPMRVVAALVLLLCAAGASDLAAQSRPVRKTGVFPDLSIRVNGKPREFRLVVPASLDLQKPAPLVFAFHGLGGNGEGMAQYTKLDELAEKDRFILVYPNAYGGDWPLNSLRSKDGVGFFDALLQALTRKYIIDPNRVYLTGMSNGALYVHLLASQRSGQIAVIAAHSGSLGILASRGINAERKYPVMVIHGDADRTIPVQYARKTRDLYQKEGHEVEYVEIHNLGHTWASSYDINDKIWDFFARHPLKE